MNVNTKFNLGDVVRTITGQEFAIGRIQVIVGPQQEDVVFKYGVDLPNYGMWAEQFLELVENHCDHSEAYVGRTSPYSDYAFCNECGVRISPNEEAGLPINWLGGK